MTPVTIDDFTAGLLTALALAKTIRSIRLDTRFYHAASVAFRTLQHDPNFDVRFRIRPHPVHGDSDTLRAGILHAIRDGIVHFESPSSTLKLSPKSRPTPVYEELASQFLKAYGQP